MKSSIRSAVAVFVLSFTSILAGCAASSAPPIDTGDETDEATETTTAPLIRGDGPPCTLQIVCNRACLQAGRADCVASCGGDSACENACANDVRGSCCNEVCR
jgi:hypothetical protein